MKNIVSNKDNNIKYNVNARLKKKYEYYFVGLLISIMLTITPFFVVNKHFFSKKVTLIIVLSCALYQILVHLKYFLHLGIRNNYFWNLLAIIFTLMVITTIFFGSTWIMFNLNHHNMI